VKSCSESSVVAVVELPIQGMLLRILGLNILGSDSDSDNHRMALVLVSVVSCNFGGIDLMRHIELVVVGILMIHRNVVFGENNCMFVVESEIVVLHRC
jgi:hypothetical protein